MSLTLRIPEQHDLSPRITVFGIGGAGGNAVNNMIVKNLEGADFVVANTDAQALQQSSSSRKLQLGTKITEGLGAGAKPELGTKAAEESLEQIIDILEGSHMCFITAGMGGGTGTGAAPVIAQAARQLGVLTVGVVTKPFQFEGAKRMRQAELGIEALQKVVDTLIIIPNQNLFRLANEKTTFTEAFSMADDVLYQGVKGVTDLMVRPGLINLDFADVRSVMDEMGKAMMGTGEATGEDRAVQAAEKAIANPLLDEISLKGALGVLINITGGEDMTLFELDEAANRIRDEVEDDANIIIGSTLDPAMDGSLRVTVVATGIDHNESMLESVKEGLNTNQKNPNGGYGYTGNQKKHSAISRPDFISASVSSRKDNASTESDEDIPLESEEQNKTSASGSSNVSESPTAAVNQIARERLMAAVRKEPNPEQYKRPIARENTPATTYGGAFNNLIQRMTGSRDKILDPTFSDKLREKPGLGLNKVRAELPARGREQNDNDRLEIPAFLRRQAN